MNDGRDRRKTDRTGDDLMEGTLKNLRHQIGRVENRVMKIEKSVYFFIIILVFIQFIPILTNRI